MSGARRSKQPISRLTRLCDAMTETLDAHPEHDDQVRCVIMLKDPEHGGIVIHGYDDEAGAMVDLIVHLQAIFEAHGKTLMILPLGRDS